MERKLSPCGENKRYPGLRRTNIFGTSKPSYDSDSSIPSEYDSDSSYNPYNEQVNESFASNNPLKSPIIGFIDKYFDSNNEFVSEICVPGSPTSNHYT